MPHQLRKNPSQVIASAILLPLSDWTSAFVRYPCRVVTHGLIQVAMIGFALACMLWDLKSSLISFLSSHLCTSLCIFALGCFAACLKLAEAACFVQRCANSQWFPTTRTRGLALCLGRQAHGDQRDQSRFTLVLHTYDIGSTGILPAVLAGFDPPYDMLEVFNDCHHLNKSTTTAGEISHQPVEPSSQLFCETFDVFRDILEVSAVLWLAALSKECVGM